MVEAGEEFEAPDYNWKIILVGNKRVGKSSITNRFLYNTFNENQASSTEVKF